MTQIVRFSPTSEIRRFQREMDSLLGQFFDAPGAAQHKDANWTPRVDVRETEHAFTVQMDLPGMKREDFQIDYHEGTLSVSGERRIEDKSEGEACIRIERSYGSFYRAFTLAKTINADAIEATYENGVLTLTLPKAEEVKPRRISVN
jgi:HSP20 family protein